MNRSRQAVKLEELDSDTGALLGVLVDGYTLSRKERDEAEARRADFGDQLRALFKKEDFLDVTIQVDGFSVWYVAGQRRASLEKMKKHLLGKGVSPVLIQEAEEASMGPESEGRVEVREISSR